MSALHTVRYGKDALDFFAGIVKIANRARAQGNFDERGDPIWDIPSWKAFCKGVRGFQHLQVANLGGAAYKTMLEVETMLEDGFDAAGIHAVLKGYEWEREQKNRRRDPGMIHRETVGS